MTAGALTLEQSPGTETARAHSTPEPGPGPARSIGEFLITGGATLLLIPLAYWYRKSAGLEHSEYLVSMVAFYAAYVINDPH